MANPFKSMIVFTHTIAKSRHAALEDADVEQWLAVDPSGQQWRTSGLARALGHEIVTHPTPAMTMLAVQLNERMLPGHVIREHVDREAALYEEHEGRKANKKVYAELREKVEGDLLPKAFIRRSTVPVLIVENKLLAFTSSPSKGDLVIALMQAIFPHVAFAGGPAPADSQRKIMSLFRFIALDGADEAGRFRANGSIVLQSELDKRVTIKNTSIPSTEINNLVIKQAHDVKEIALQAADESVAFRLDRRFIFKGIEFDGMRVTDVAGDSDDAVAQCAAYAVIAGSTLNTVVNDLLDRIALDEGAVDVDGDEEL